MAQYRINTDQGSFVVTTEEPLSAEEQTESNLLRLIEESRTQGVLGVEEPEGTGRETPGEVLRRKFTTLPRMEDLRRAILGPLDPTADPFFPQRVPNPYGTPTLPQIGAELSGGLAGGLAGTPFAGMPGRVIGTGIGTFGGGALSGRGLVPSGIDAIEAAIGEMVMGGAASKASRFLVPSASEKSLAALGSRQTVSRAPSDLLLKGPKQTNIQIGRAQQDALDSLRSKVEAAKDAKYAPVVAAAPSVDIQDINTFARQQNLTLPRTGMDIAEGAEKLDTIAVSVPGVKGAVSVDVMTNVSTLSFDDAIKMRSKLFGLQRFYSSKVPGFGDPIKAAAYTDLGMALDAKMEAAATAGGVAKEWRAANKFAKEEYYNRYANDFIRDIVEKSADEVVPTLLHANYNEVVEYFRAMSQLDKTVSGAIPRLRAGILANIIRASTDEMTGVLRPDLLLNQFKNTALKEPEIADLLLGKQIADGMKDFARSYAKSITRLVTVVGGAGAAAVAGGLASTGAGAGVMLGTIETANELNFLGRMIVKRPSLMQAMKETVLTGKEDRLSKIDPLRLIRMATTGAVTQGVMQYLPQPDFADMMRDDEISLEEKIEAAQERLQETKGIQSSTAQMPIDQRIGMSQQLLPRPVTR